MLLYSPVAGTVLSPGTQPLSVMLTPVRSGSSPQGWLPFYDSTLACLCWVLLHLEPR
jgi:hypothetical protein